MIKTRPITTFIILLCISWNTSAQTAKPITANYLDYRKDGAGYLLVLKAGQPVVASLNAFMEKEKLPGAYFSGIGAVKNIEIAYYNIDQKKYVYKKFAPSMEVLSLNGNIGYFESKPIVHPHIALAASDYTVHGGHLKEAEVSLILEIFITPTSKAITREWNKDFPELKTMTTIRDTIIH